MLFSAICNIRMLMNFLISECTQLEDPRLEWRAIQEAMLRDYLNTAQDALEVSRLDQFFE